MAVNAGGYKVFGPTYNSTKYVRFGHEGTVNSMHAIDPTLVPPADTAVEELAGKIAAIKADGSVGLCTADTDAPVGLFVDDLGDIVGASGKGSFYFRGGEYYISVARMAADVLPTAATGDTEATTGVVPGTKLYANAEGKLTTTSNDKGVVAIATTAPEVFTTGNMYENAGEAANGGLFVGISLKV